MSAPVGRTGSPSWVRAFPDSCDVGLEVVGRDGAVRRFYVDEVEHGRDGDVVAWHLRPVDPKVRVSVVRFTIFND